jgi:hypothetical protein
MSSVSGPRAIFGVSKKDIAAVLMRALAMYNNMTSNSTMFASPTISLVSFLALITALSTAQQKAVETKARGSATFRNTKRDALWTGMELLQKYAQSLADVLTAENAASLILAAGLVVAKSPKRQKVVLAAALTTTPGLVTLAANRSALVAKADLSKSVTFNWQWSTDGKTWTNAGSTPLASTEIAGLTLMTTYTFRVSVTVSRVTGAWSQPVSIVVH